MLVISTQHGGTYKMNHLVLMEILVQLDPPSRKKPPHSWLAAGHTHRHKKDPFYILRCFYNTLQLCQWCQKPNLSQFHELFQVSRTFSKLHRLTTLLYSPVEHIIIHSYFAEEFEIWRSQGTQYILHTSVSFVDFSVQFRPFIYHTCTYCIHVHVEGKVNFQS